MVGFEAVPGLSKIPPQAAADEDRSACFVRHREGRAKRSGDLDAVAIVSPAFGIAVDVDDYLAVVTARPPKEILVIPADRRRQAVGLAIDVDRRRLAVVGGENRGGAAFGLGQAALDARHLGLECAPA